MPSRLSGKPTARERRQPGGEVGLPPGRARELRRLARTGALLALGLALFILENAFFPVASLVSLPGAKLGLANLAVLAALELDGLAPAAAVSLLRVLLAGIFSGTVGAAAFWLSLGGAVSSLVGMALGRHLPGIGPVGISVIGAVCHNLGQLAALKVLMPNAATLIFLPWLVLLAIPAGLITGLIAVEIIKRLGP